MPSLELEEPVNGLSPGWVDSTPSDSPGIAGSRAIIDVRQYESALTPITGRVLLIEPAIGERTWLRNELISGQMEVFEATDLITALRGLAIFQPNLILAQMRLPTYCGMELLRRLKQDGATQGTPVFLYSDMATADERVLAIELGASDVLCKPFVGAELLARLRAALRNRHLVTVLEQRAHLDGLTGLANRRTLDEQLPREWEACRRRSCPLAVAIADLDHFKRINDRHGHAAGDRVLRESAAVLAKAVRSSDLVARYGGEEFVVVASDCDVQCAVRLVERFRAAIAGLEFVEEGTRVPVTTSIGVAAFTDLAQDSPAELLRRADEALYSAKKAGRDAVWVWEQGQGTPRPAAAGTLDNDR